MVATAAKLVQHPLPFFRLLLPALIAISFALSESLAGGADAAGAEQDHTIAADIAASAGGGWASIAAPTDSCPCSKADGVAEQGCSASPMTATLQTGGPSSIGATITVGPPGDVHRTLARAVEPPPPKHA